MQQIVYYVAGYKASPFFYRCLRLECEFSCKVEVAEQTDNVAYRIGYINVNDQFKQQVDSIMDDCCYTSHDCESDELNSDESVPKPFNSADFHLYVYKELYHQRRFHLLLRSPHNFLSGILNNQQIHPL